MPNWVKINKCKLIKVLGASECDNCKDHDKCWGNKELKGWSSAGFIKGKEQGMKIIIRVEQNNGTNIQVEGNEKEAIVTSKEEYTGSGDLLMAIAESIKQLARLSS